MLSTSLRTRHDRCCRAVPLLCLIPAITALLWAVDSSAAIVDTIYLELKVRDFKSTHPDFSSFQGCAGIDFVELTLGSQDDTSAQAQHRYRHGP